MKVTIGRYPKDYTKVRKIEVRIDDHDTWSLDHTLAHIIVPSLKKLKELKQSYPLVDDCDVPEELRSANAPALTQEEIDCGHWDENAKPRWDWVLDQMIWSFEQSMNDNWEDQYWLDDLNLDRDGMLKHQEKMLQGRMLFAKYYQSLWS
jgi:hypothetical protein